MHREWKFKVYELKGNSNFAFEPVYEEPSFDRAMDWVNDQMEAREEGVRIMYIVVSGQNGQILYQSGWTPEGLVHVEKETGTQPTSDKDDEMDLYTIIMKNGKGVLTDAYEKEVRELLNDQVDVRPYNVDMQRDGSWNFVHRIKVAALTRRMLNRMRELEELVDELSPF